MPGVSSFKNNFTAGEISPELYGRPDLASYANGAAELRNVLIRPTGGVTRRPGLRHLLALPPEAGSGLRLAAFDFNNQQAYLLVFLDHQMRVLREDAEVASLGTPWAGPDLAQISWAQNADTLFVCHPDYPPQRITRQSHTDWTIAAFAFLEDETSHVLRQPSFKFADEAVTLQPSAASGSITLTASADVFDAQHVGLRFRLKKKEVTITAVSSPTSATADCVQSLADTAATRDWEEQAFSSRRGWPIAVTLTQERLVFAGSRDLPNRIWMSKISDITNFDLGTALDDEAIEFSLLTDRVDAIRAALPGRHLQIFTTGAEWMISGEPLSPTKVRSERQTRAGSVAGRQIPPRFVDGATLFIEQSGRELRQFLYTDVEQSYSSDNISLVASHILRDPLDMDYEAESRLLLLPLGNGQMAVQTNFRAQQILAWTRLATQGAFLCVAVMARRIYVATRRGPEEAPRFGVECFDPECFTDAALLGESDLPQDSWSGLDHLEGFSVRLRADGVDAGDALVSGGAVTLARPARRLEAGLAFAHAIQPLPAEIGGDGSIQARPMRLVRAVFRLQESGACIVDTGQGPRPMSFARFGAPGQALDGAPALFTGDREWRGLGWVRGLDRPLWRLEQDTAQPFTLLSVSTELKGGN